MSKILLVDDSETLRSQLKRLVESNGYSVLEAADGKQGLDVLSKNSDVSLIVCDVNMPIMDGITMCMKVSEDPKLNTIPIFMLTTESNIEMKEKGKKAGVKAWITKPFEDVKIVAAIGKILGK